MTAEGCLGGGGDARAGAFFWGGPAEGLMGVRATEFGKEGFDPLGVNGSRHEGNGGLLVVVKETPNVFLGAEDEEDIVGLEDTSGLWDADDFLDLG